jgi:hypothetical protein
LLHGITEPEFLRCNTMKMPEIGDSTEGQECRC